MQSSETYSQLLKDCFWEYNFKYFLNKALTVKKEQ